MKSHYWIEELNSCVQSCSTSIYWQYHFLALTWTTRLKKLYLNNKTWKSLAHTLLLNCRLIYVLPNYDFIHSAIFSVYSCLCSKRFVVNYDCIDYRTLFAKKLCFRFRKFSFCKENFIKSCFHENKVYFCYCSLNFCD